MEYALKTVLREAEIWTIGNNKKKNRPISRVLYTSSMHVIIYYSC